MRILVVGAGSVGGYFGGRLLEAGRDVTFLVRKARAAQLAKDGLRIISPHGDAQLTPTLVTAGAIAGAYDAIILAVKAFALDGALDDLAPAVGPTTMIVPLLNGMKHVDTIRARFGERSLVGGYCKCATTLDAEGRVVQFADFQELAYGELDGSTSARIGALDAALKNAGFDARLSETVERGMWEKWVMLAALGTINCLFRGTVGDVASAPGGLSLANAIVDEVVTAVAKVGIAPRDNYVNGLRGMLTERSSTQTSSMYRDLQAGNAVETDQILGDLAARAQRAGIPVPLVSAAHTQLSIYGSRRSA